MNKDMAKKIVKIQKISVEDAFEDVYKKVLFTGRFFCIIVILLALLNLILTLLLQHAGQSFGIQLTIWIIFSLVFPLLFFTKFVVLKKEYVKSYPRLFLFNLILATITYMGMIMWVILQIILFWKLKNLLL